MIVREGRYFWFFFYRGKCFLCRTVKILIGVNVEGRGGRTLQTDEDEVS